MKWVNQEGERESCWCLLCESYDKYTRVSVMADPGEGSDGRGGGEQNRRTMSNIKKRIRVAGDRRAFRRTRSTIDNLRFVFDQVDVDGDGVIKRAKFEDLLVHFGISKNSIEAHERLQNSGYGDQDNITFSEFTSVVEEWGTRGKGINVDVEAERWANDPMLIDETGTIFDPKNEEEETQKSMTDRYSVIPLWMVHDERFKKLVAGGIAGIFAKTFVAPADRVKILFQVHSSKKFTILNAVRESVSIVNKEGVPALWRGNWATVLRVFPYAGIQFLTFDMYSAYLKGTRPAKADERYVPEFWRLQGERLLSGAMAGATSVAVTYPLDLVRARMAVQQLDPTAAGNIGVVNTFRSIVREEGYYGLFRGMKPTLIGILPYAGFAFLGFHWMKSSVERIKQREILWWERLLCGSLAGLTAQSMSYPLDMVRRRMQTERVVFADTREVSRYESINGTLSMIRKSEGFRGLFKGLTMNWLKGPLAVGISFAANDYIRREMGVLEKREVP